jgi:hypothetical protein
MQIGGLCEEAVGRSKGAAQYIDDLTIGESKDNIRMQR